MTIDTLRELVLRRPFEPFARPSRAAIPRAIPLMKQSSTCGRLLRCISKASLPEESRYPSRTCSSSPSRLPYDAASGPESERQLEELIRRRLAMPIEQRMNFLRKRLPGGGSCL